MTTSVVIDASLATMWAVPESYSAQALDLASRWARESTRLLAPCLLLAEVTNALYNRVVRGEMDVDTAQTALEVILGSNSHYEARDCFVGYCLLLMNFKVLALRPTASR